MIYYSGHQAGGLPDIAWKGVADRSPPVFYIMIESTIIMPVYTGSAATALTYFVQRASEFDSVITVHYLNQHANAKSLIGMLSMGIEAGDEIRISADGPDEVDALAAMLELIALDFQYSWNQNQN